MGERNVIDLSGAEEALDVARKIGLAHVSEVRISAPGRWGREKTNYQVDLMYGDKDAHAAAIRTFGDGYTLTPWKQHECEKCECLISAYAEWLVGRVLVHASDFGKFTKDEILKRAKAKAEAASPRSRPGSSHADGGAA